MEMNGDAFSFYDSRNSLQSAINQQTEGTNLVAIIPASIFFPIQNHSHFYAICNFKEHGENHLYIFDSRPNDVAKNNHQGPGLAKHLGLNNIKIYYPHHSRQHQNEFNGFAYALKDARLLTAIPFNRPEMSQVLDKDTDKYEFILPQSFHYDAGNFYNKCFEKLLGIDLKEQEAFKARKNKLFFTHLGAGLTMGLISFVSYQLGHLSKMDEVCKNSLSL